MKLFVIYVLAALMCTAEDVKAEKPPIVIGQTSAFSGGPASSVLETAAGAKLIIDDQNNQGGIRGQKIKLISLDDGYEPKRAVENTRILAREHKAIALLLSRGTETSEAMLPALKEFGIPLIGPSTGAMSLRVPTQPLVFNVRSSYQGEARKTVNQIVSMGYSKIGIIYVDDSFGRDVHEGLLNGLSDSKATPTFVEKFERNQVDFSQIINSAVKSNPQTLILVGTTKPVKDLMIKLNAAGVRPYMATLSNNASESFLQTAKDLGIQVIVSQVFPGERALHEPLIYRLSKLTTNAASADTQNNNLEDGPMRAVQAKLRSGMKISPAMIEGAAAAIVLIEGLKRTTGEPTSTGLISALNNGQPINIGWTGKYIKYTPNNHSGIEFVDVSITSKDGKFIR